MLEEELADDGRFTFNNTVDYILSLISRYGTLGPRTLIHDLKLYFSKKPVGKAHRDKCGLRGFFTGIAQVMGIIYPMYLSPEMGLNLQSIFLQIMGFTPGVAYVSGILLMALGTSALAAWLCDKLLDRLFNHYYETSHSKLCFTPEEIKELLKKPNILHIFKNEELLDKVIELLQDEFSHKVKQNKTHKSHITLLDISDALREGRPIPLISYLNKKIAGKKVKLADAKEGPKLTPEETVTQFLQLQSTDASMHMDMLVSLAQTLNQKPSDSEDRRKKGKLARIGELIRLLNRPDDEEDFEPIIASESLTPALDNAKVAKNRQKVEALEKLLDSLGKPANIPAAQMRQ